MIPAVAKRFDLAAPHAGYVAFHFRLSRHDYDANISAGRRFYAVDGEALDTADEVKAALRRDGEVVSR